jgi:hypothetical protein
MKTKNGTPSIPEAVKDLREISRAFVAGQITYSEMTIRNGIIWTPIAKANLIQEVLAALTESYRADGTILS